MGVERGERVDRAMLPYRIQGLPGSAALRRSAGLTGLSTGTAARQALPRRGALQCTV